MKIEIGSKVKAKLSPDWEYRFEGTVININYGLYIVKYNYLGKEPKYFRGFYYSDLELQEEIA